MVANDGITETAKISTGRMPTYPNGLVLHSVCTML